MAELLVPRPTGAPKFPGSALPGFLGFKQKIPVEIRRRGFLVKTVSTRQELVQAFRLRYDVFHREFIGKKFPIGLDTDRFDTLGDLLVIIDEKTKRVVGTYRLISSNFSDKFYSETEFHIEQFLSLPGPKLELSRACVHRQYRNGTVIHLLWRGIAQYMQATGAKYLFGCSSVKTTDPRELGSLYHFLQTQNSLTQKYGTKPRPSYRLPTGNWLSTAAAIAPETLPDIPPLLRSYLKAGALLEAEPALDAAFKCFDFFTVLRAEDLAESYGKKYVG